MAFSVTCPQCKRTFADIDDSMLWQKAKCRCGDTVELVPDIAKPKNSVQQAAAESAAKSAPAKKAKQSRRSGASAKRSQSSRPKRVVNRRKELEDPKVPRKKRTTHSKRPAEVAETPTQKDKQTETEFIPDNFADLDNILASGVDNSPLENDRPWAETDRTDAITSPTSFHPNKKIGQSKGARLGARFGSTVAAIAGTSTAALVLSTRFTEFPYTPLGWIGQTLYGAQHASFGTGEMSDMCVSAFTWLGWLLALLSLPLMVFSLLLFVRAALRGAAKKLSNQQLEAGGSRFFPWARGGLATVSVVCLFVLLGLMATQSTHHHQLNRSLDEFQAPIEGLLPDEDLANVKVKRDQYESEKQTFTIGIASFAIFPLIAFTGSAVSLFCEEK